MCFLQAFYGTLSGCSSIAVGGQPRDHAEIDIHNGPILCHPRLGLASLVVVGGSGADDEYANHGREK